MANKFAKKTQPAKSKAREVEPDEDEDEDEEEEAPRRPAAKKKATSKPPGKAAAGKPAKAKRRSKWSGVKADGDRDPIPPPGDYLITITNLEELYNEGNGNETVRVSYTIDGIADGGEGVAPGFDEDVKEGNTYVAIFVISGNGKHAGQARVKAFFVKACGFATEDEYDEFDPDGEFIDDQLAAGEEGELIGREVNAIVKRGKPRGEDGDYYRDFKWLLLDDSRPINA